LELQLLQPFYGPLRKSEHLSESTEKAIASLLCKHLQVQKPAKAKWKNPDIWTWH